jgi:NTE family protein
MNVINPVVAEQPQAAVAPEIPGQIVLVLQGGGALNRTGCTSIGAINVSLIAGNRAAQRLDRLKESWRPVERPDIAGLGWPWGGVFGAASDFMTLMGGVPGFFKTNPARSGAPMSARDLSAPATIRPRRSQRC